MAKVTDPDNLDRFQVCIDPIAETISLRGLGTERHAADQTGDSAGTVVFTDVGANFVGDGVAVDDILTIISDPAEDGGIIGHYRVVGSIAATSFDVDRAIPASAAADLTYKVNAPQTTGAVGEQLADGVNMQTLFSFLKEEWITLSGLGNEVDLNRFDFPIVAISSAAGQYILGGVNGDAASTWSFQDTTGVQATDTEGVSRELIRDGGWQERDAANVVLREYANYTTLGSLDSDAQATYQQGDATGAPANFKLTGPVNQAVLTFGPDVGPDIVTLGFDIDNTAKTITRNDGGNWATDNYRAGDFITIRAAEDPANDGTYGPITAVDDSVDGAVTIPSATWTTNIDDTTVIFSVDHRRYTQLRSRKKARSYVSAVHADAGIPTTGILALVNKFPLSHQSDPAITLDDGLLSGGDGTAGGDIFQQIEAHTTAADGVTTDLGDGTFTFDSAGGGFQTLARTINVLQPGDSAEITSGGYQGVYEIKSVDSDTSLTLFHEPLRTYPGDETTLGFTVRTGVRDVGAANATLADVDGATGTLTSVGSTFDVDTAIGDRDVTAGDIVEVSAGDAVVLGYYKVVSQDTATQLTVNTADQIFSGETNQSYRIWRPGMFLQRFQTTATEVGPITSFDFNDANPDTIDRNDAGNFLTDGYDTEGMMLTVTLATVAANNGQRILGAAPAALLLTLIAEETLTADVVDTTAVLNGEYGIIRTINAIKYPFHWRLFANGATLAQVFQFIQRELRRATDIDGGSATARGDITDLLMSFVSPNGTTTDLFPDDLSTAELNNVTYQDISGDSRNNAFLVGITFDVNANLISSANKRLVAYFTSVPSGNFGTNDAVIVDDDQAADMDWTAIAGDIQTTFDYTNNSQGGRTPDTDAAITVVALGDDLAQHVLVTALIEKKNAVVVAVQPPLERNFDNP
jgi:hypothetical protein